MLESGVIPVGEGNVLMAKHTEKSFLTWLSIYDAAPNASCQSRKERSIHYQQVVLPKRLRLL